MTTSPLLAIPEQLKCLAHLQQVDLQLDLLKRKQLGNVQEKDRLYAQVSQERQQLEAKQQERGVLEKEKTQVQAAFDLAAERLEKNQGQLERLKTTQEFQAATREAEQLKKMKDTLCAQQDAKKLQIEAIDEQLRLLEEVLSQKQLACHSFVQDQEKESGSFQVQVESFEAQRQSLQSQLSRELVSRYQRVRSARKGLAVVMLEGGVCQGCHRLVPPQMENEVRRSSVLHACPFCQRLLMPSEAPVISVPSL